MKINEMAQFAIGLILFGFLNAIILDTDLWRAIDEYVYVIIFVAAAIFIFSNFGWKGLFLAIRFILCLAILIILGVAVLTALAGIALSFTPDPPLLIIFGHSSIWSTLLCCGIVLGMVVFIWKLMCKFHWE